MSLRVVLDARSSAERAVEQFAFLDVPSIGVAAASGGLEAELIDLLAVFIIAGAVGVFVAKVGRFPYTIALLVAGFAVSLISASAGGPNRILGDIQLTHDVILLVLLPPLLFEGAATTDFEELRRNLPVILVLAVVGLIGSIVFVGFVTFEVFTGLGLVTSEEFPLLVAMLFATVVLPTDPVSVLALFEDVGAPERLSVLVEGESLINDGVAVVIFTTLYALVTSENRDLGYLLEPANFGAVLVDLVYTSLGGAVVGFAAGYVIYSVMRDLDEHMTEIVLTIILAYGSFLLAEHYLHVSGVIATVVAGLLMGNRGAEYAMSPQTKLSVFNTWETGAFIVNTFIFLVIGAKTPIGDIITHIDLLVVAIAIVLLGRAIAVYPITGVMNRFVRAEVSLSYQHVWLWGGLHASIPIALVLGIPDTVPFAEEMRVLVFGIAAFSLVVQGLTMKPLIQRLGILTKSDEEELYQLLVGRARAVDAALESAEELQDEGRIPDTVYERFMTEYVAEKEELNRAIGRLLTEHPEIRDRQQLVGEQRILRREQSAIKDAELDGMVSTEVAEALLEEVHLKLDRVDAGESTVSRDPDVEGYAEFWRQRAGEKGLLDEQYENGSDTADSATSEAADDEAADGS